MAEAEKRGAASQSGAASIGRRMKTPLPLTFKWHVFSMYFIMFAVFVFANLALCSIMESGGRDVYFGIFSCRRPPNSLDIDVYRRIYYVDLRAVSALATPAAFLFFTGAVMQAARLFVLKRKVAAGLADNTGTKAAGK